MTATFFFLSKLRICKMGINFFNFFINIFFLILASACFIWSLTKMISSTTNITIRRAEVLLLYVRTIFSNSQNYYVFTQIVKQMDISFDERYIETTNRQNKSWDKTKKSEKLLKKKTYREGSTAPVSQQQLGWVWVWFLRAQVFIWEVWELSLLI